MLHLRAPEPSDLDFLFRVENNIEQWQFSNTRAPYSRAQLLALIENTQDIYENKQCRFMVQEQNLCLGMVDVFGADMFNGHASVGVFIDPKHRGKGKAKEALRLLCTHCKLHFGLHSLLAQVETNNIASVHVFSALGFKEVGTLKAWRRVINAERKNHVIFQKIL